MNCRVSKFNYGGQAVIEGVMMRGRRAWAVAVRRADKEIILEEGSVKSVVQKYPILGKPLIRGSVALVESLVFGIKCLTFSANAYAEEEAGEELTVKELIFTFGLAFLLTVGFFIMLPAFIVRLVESAISNNILLNAVEGLIKITLFVGYIAGISLMKDIQRVFQYHGAEHRTINCYEAGDPLTVENVQKHSSIHARCGTNFLLITLFTSIFVFSFFGRPAFLLRVLTHIAILPIVAGLSYEVIRQAGKEQPHPIFKAIAAPGMALQLLTTREPDDEQVEVAIAALKAVLDKDHHFDDEHQIKQFPSVHDATK